MLSEAFGIGASGKGSGGSSRAPLPAGRRVRVLLLGDSGAPRSRRYLGGCYPSLPSLLSLVFLFVVLLCGYNCS